MNLKPVLKCFIKKKNLNSCYYKHLLLQAVLLTVYEHVL